MVLRQNTDRSSDYQVWARDDSNNAMGNLYATTMWPIDGAEAPGNNVGASMQMGGSDLLIQAQLSTTPPAAEVQLRWVLASKKDPWISNAGQDPGLPSAIYDPASSGSGDNCVESGRALDGAVRYVICFFEC